MPQFIYKRDAVPVGQTIRLDVQFADSAGNLRNTDSTPTVEITDAASIVVEAAGIGLVNRIGPGLYRREFTVPTSFVEGMWNDSWAATVDGYAIAEVFDFVVNSAGSAEAVNTVVEVEMQIGDLAVVDWSQGEILGINLLLQALKARLSNDAFTPEGEPCPAFPDADLVQFLCASLAEFNATPAITEFMFDNPVTYQLAAEMITQGAYLIAIAAIAHIEAGREFVLNDNGVAVNPPPVSSTLMNLYQAQLNEYRAKLKEFKRNIRGGPLGIGAGSLLVVSPQFRRLRHLKERRIV